MAETAMRAAVVYDCLYPSSTGGGERVYRRLAELLVERGFEVDYVTRQQWESTPPEGSFRVVPVWSGAIYDSHGTRTLGGAIGFARAVRRQLRQERPYDVVIASALPVLTLLAAASATKRRRTYLIADWLEVWPWRKWRAYSGAVAGTVAFVLQWFGARSAQAHSVNSSFTAARLSKVNRRADPVVLGLVDLVETPSTPPRSTDPAQLLFVGRHIPDKRLVALPPALAVVAAERPDARLVVVGTGPETDAARRSAEAAGVADRVEFRGRVDDGVLAELMAASAVLVSPSAREGFGLVVAEAAALGTPSVVVAGEDNAAVELIEDGCNGYVAPSADPTALGKAILEALAGGVGLRMSTAAWFARERQERALGPSLDELLDRRRSAAS